MIIEDIHGNVIANPDLNKGRLEKAIRNNTPSGEPVEEPYVVYIYFPFDEEEQQYFYLVNKAQVETDAAICELYEMMG